MVATGGFQPTSGAEDTRVSVAVGVIVGLLALLIAMAIAIPIAVWFIRKKYLKNIQWFVLSQRI